MLNNSAADNIFIRLAAVASQTYQPAQNSEKIWTYSSSSSSKVDDFGTNRKRICDFLLVINSKFGHILHRFWDTSTYWLKTAHFSHTAFIRRPRSLSSLWSCRVKLSVRKLESCGYLWWRLHDPNFNVFDWSTRVTDGGTDRRTGDSISRYSISSLSRQDLVSDIFDKIHFL